MLEHEEEGEGEPGRVWPTWPGALPQVRARLAGAACDLDSRRARVVEVDDQRLGLPPERAGSTGGRGGG